MIYSYYEKIRNKFRTLRYKVSKISYYRNIDIVKLTNEINAKGYKSTSNYFIFVHLASFTVNVFVKKNGKWENVKSYLCTIGKPSTPTIKGDFKVGIKGYVFGINKGYKCYYYTQFKGNYLFHSIIYNLNDTVRDGRLGMQLSDGCIRLAKENAKWIWDNIPTGTSVHIE